MTYEHIIKNMDPIQKMEYSDLSHYEHFNKPVKTNIRNLRIFKTLYSNDVYSSSSFKEICLIRDIKGVLDYFVNGCDLIEKSLLDVISELSTYPKEYAAFSIPLGIEAGCDLKDIREIRDDGIKAINNAIVYMDRCWSFYYEYKARYNVSEDKKTIAYMLISYPDDVRNAIKVRDIDTMRFLFNYGKRILVDGSHYIDSTVIKANKDIESIQRDYSSETWLFKQSVILSDDIKSISKDKIQSAFNDLLKYKRFLN